MMEANRLKVFISGGGRDLGLRLAQSFSADGHEVYAASRQAFSEDSQSGSGSIHKGQLDVSSWVSCKEAIIDATAKMGGIDLLINNASAANGPAEIGEIDDDTLSSDLNVTLGGAVRLTNEFVRTATTKKRQHIVLISSSSGLFGADGNERYSTYAMAKAGLRRFADSLSGSLMKDDTSIHVVTPCNIRDNEWSGESAVSPSDVYRAVQMVCTAGDNLQIDEVVLRPRLSE